RGDRRGAGHGRRQLQGAAAPRARAAAGTTGRARMNTNDSRDRETPLDANLRLQLRGLRRDIEPEGDLWPGIAARIAATPQAARPAAPVRRGHGATRFAPWALAASLVLTVGVAWKLQPPSLPPAQPAAAQDATVAMLDRQADAM